MNCFLGKRYDLMDEIFFQLDVSDNGHVWGVNKNQDIYRWTGKNWQHIGGKAIQVTVGPSGVWVVNRANNIYYRKGTYGDSNTAGSGVSHKNKCLNDKKIGNLKIGHLKIDSFTLQAEKC